MVDWKGAIACSTKKVRKPTIIRFVIQEKDCF
jgi:hypothetical protein